MKAKYPTMVKVDLDDEAAPWNSKADPWRKQVKAAYRSTEGDTSGSKFVPDYWLVKVKVDYLLFDQSIGASELVWTYKQRTSASYSRYFDTKAEALTHMRSVEQVEELQALVEQQADHLELLRRSIAIDRVWPKVFDSGEPVTGRWVGQPLSQTGGRRVWSFEVTAAGETRSFPAGAVAPPEED